MNNSQINNTEHVNHVQVQTEFPKTITRAGEILGACAGGAFCGYIFYWCTRLMAATGISDKLKDSASITPLPYILSGITAVVIVETARLTYDVMLSILGDKQKYHTSFPIENGSTLDCFRKHTWKVVNCVEKTEHVVDVIFSRIFRIRTAKEILETSIQDRDLYFAEIARRCFGEQLLDTISTAVPQELGIYAVEACGYVILGGHLFVWLHGLIFFNGLIDKIGKVYQKIHSEQQELTQNEDLQNNTDCDTLNPVQSNG